MDEKFKFIFSTVMGIIVLLIVIATEIKLRNEKIINVKNVFIVIALLGFIMCCMGKAVQANGWANPIVIICILLGIVTLLLVVLFLTGRLNINDKTAFRLLYSIIILKWGLTTVHHIIKIVQLPSIHH